MRSDRCTIDLQRNLQAFFILGSCEDWTGPSPNPYPTSYLTYYTYLERPPCQSFTISLLPIQDSKCYTTLASIPICSLLCVHLPRRSWNNLSCPQFLPRFPPFIRLAVPFIRDLSRFSRPTVSTSPHLLRIQDRAIGRLRDGRSIERIDFTPLGRCCGRRNRRCPCQCFGVSIGFVSLVTSGRLLHPRSDGCHCSA
jgi:hypothetical protein